MNRRFQIVVVGGLWLGLLAWFAYFQDRHAMPEKPDVQIASAALLAEREGSAVQPTPVRGRPLRKSHSGLRLHPVTQTGREIFQTAETTGEEDRQYLQMLIQTYAQIFDRVPFGGENAEITAALRGGNAKGLALLDPEESPMNDRGELLDRWGNPWVFHSISSQRLEIISRGPDGKLWTDDDIGELTRTGNAQAAGGGTGSVWTSGPAPY